MSKKRFAIIVAGGSGSRMKTERPKQFLLLKNKPILLHTLEKFLSDESIQLILVLPKTEIDYWNEQLIPDFPEFVQKAQQRLLLVEGGATRFQSVKNGLTAIEANEGIVAVHDGVRPLISSELVEESFRVAEEKKAVVVSVPLKDSARMVLADGSNKMIDRSSVRLMQTPQTFELALLKAAFEQNEEPFFTDDASVVEHFGHPITLIEGDYTNLKITTPEDLLIAERLI